MRRINDDERPPKSHELQPLIVIERQTHRRVHSGRFGCRACPWQGSLSEGTKHVTEHQYAAGGRSAPQDAA